MGSIYNILLFGESGAGKSTTINALANYLRYTSFDQADSGKFVKVIPSKITLIHPKTFKDLVCEDDDSDANERHNDNGHSVTQSAKNYDFQFRGKTIRIIDTPGMGDTGGLEVDKQNFKNILEHLKTFGTLHGICFLIKTNTTRKTAAFRYCINQLMTHIPRSACANIVFCFTFSRNSLYGPGDGYATLKEHLRSSDLGCEKIELKSKENCFYIDNEAFRYLLAKKHGFPFTEDKKPQFLESWNKSTQQTLSMITRIVDNFEPFKIETIFLLLDYRKFIQELSEPINWLKQKIESELEEQKKRAKSFKTGSNSYQQNLINNVKSYSDELELLREFIIKLIQFMVINLNTNCHNLIRPYLSLFTDDGQASQHFLTAIQQESPNLPKRSKLSTEQTDVPASATTLAKINRIIESFKKKNQNQIGFGDLRQSGQKLANLKYSGNQISKIIGIEPMPTSKAPKFPNNQDKLTGVRNQIVENRTKSKGIKRPLDHGQVQPTNQKSVVSRISSTSNPAARAEIKVKINLYEATNSTTQNSARNYTQNQKTKSKIPFTPEYSRNSQLNNNNNNFNSPQKNNKFNPIASTSTELIKSITKQPNRNKDSYTPNSNSRNNNQIDHNGNVKPQNTNPKVPKPMKKQSNQRVVPENQINNPNNSDHNRNLNPNFKSYTQQTRQTSNYDYEAQRPTRSRNFCDQLADLCRDCFNSC